MFCLALPLGLKAEEPAEPELEAIPPPPGLTTSASALPLTSAAAAVSPAVAMPEAVAAQTRLSAPSNLTATAENRQVHLGWYPSDGPLPVSGYLVFRGIGPDAISSRPLNRVPVTEAYFDDNDLNSEDPPLNRFTYYYRVRAFDTEGRLSAASDIASALPNGPLLPPGKLNHEALDGIVKLSWAAPISTGLYDLSAYKVFRSEKTGEAGALQVTLPPSTSTFEDAQVTNGKAYYYTVRSLDSSGALSDSSPEVKAVAFRPLKAPTGLSALGVGDESVRLKWEASPGGGTFKVKGYNIYRSTTAPVDLASNPVNKALVGPKPVFEDGPEDSVEAPKKGTDYHYAVVAVDDEGRSSPPSAESVAGPVASLTGISTGEFEIIKGNTLQIQGRKTINTSNTWTIKAADAKNTQGSGSAFDMKQQLQVRLTGKVGRKIKVDVDYDDATTNTEKQKISVVYTGDQQEVFKEFAFGDILMDLSSSRTEFAGYNKSLFGAKMKLESPDSRLKLTAIGAQTKGYTETKRVVGGFEQAKTGNTLGLNIQDTAFQRNRYYFLSRDAMLVEGSDYIEPGSVQIYLDRPGFTNLPGVNNTIISDSSGSPVFHFIPLNPAQDFTVDALTGLVTFNYYIRPDDNIAVAYRRNSADGLLVDKVGYNASNDFDFDLGRLDSDWEGGLSGALVGGKHMIQFPRKYGNQYDGHMSFQFYSLGNTNILNPQLDPEFKLVVYGTNQAPLYQISGRDDFRDVLEFDTRLGIMRFRVAFPFKEGTNSANNFRIDAPTYSNLTQPFQPSNQDAYNSSPTGNYSIHVEYKYKLTNYFLRFNIVRGSEYITLDGRKLTRELDYYLDYESGQLIFSNPEQIRDDSVIEATYEYLPFSGQFTSTIFGTREEYQVTKDLSVGSTFLWNSSDAPLEVPDARSTPYSLQILDGDIQMAIPQDGLDALMALIPGQKGKRMPLKVKGSAELARSWHQPNTYSRNNESGVAMLDAFESLDESISTSLDENAWLPASRPGISSGSLSYADRRFSKFVNISEEGHDAQQRLDAGENPKRTLILVQYGGMDTPERWDSFIYPLGLSYLERMKDATYLEIWVKVNNDVVLNVDVGDISEDANANNFLDRESQTGTVNKDNDIGLLNSTTVGSPYPRPEVDGSRYTDVNYWGRENNASDTEDLDANGVLGANSNFYRFSQVLRQADGTVSLNNFQRILVPLTSAQTFGFIPLSVVPGSPDYYRYVKHVRLWFQVPAGSGAGGEIKIESIQFKVNKWQVRADPSLTTLGGLSVTANNDKIQVTGVNRIVAPQVAKGFSYPPNTSFFRKETSKAEDREQSMQLEYAFTSLDQTGGRPHLHVRKELSRVGDVDLGYYEKLRLDLYKPHETLPGEILLVRLGFDDANYFEYQVLLDQYAISTWHTVTLALDGSDGKRRQVGKPYLRKVKYLYLTVLTNNNLLNTDPRLIDKAQREILWIDNLRTTDAQAREGTAYRISANYDLFDGKITVNQDYREVESDFTKIDKQNDDPLRHERGHSLNGGLNFIPGMPVTLRYEDRQYFSELKRREDPKYTRNFQDPDESVQRYGSTVAVNLIPRVALNSTANYETGRKTYLPTYIESQHLLQPLHDREFNPNSRRQELVLFNRAELTGPDWAKGFNGDRINADLSYKSYANYLDKPSVRKDNLSFRSSAREERIFKTSFTGVYKIPRFVTVSPALRYTWAEARGDIPVPSARNPYYKMAIGEGVVEYTPQSREVNPQLGMQFESIPVLKLPRLTYNFTQTRDFLRNDMRTPGSLDFSTDMDLNEAFGNPTGGIPKLNFTQNWSVDSTLNNDERIHSAYGTKQLNDWLNDDKNSEFKNRYQKGTPLQSYPHMAFSDQDRQEGWGLPGLEGAQLWWVRMDNGLGEDTRRRFHVETLAQNSYRKSSSNLSTRFDLTPFEGWKGTYTPRVNWTEDRTMAAPEQVTLRKKFSFGSGIDFAEPGIFRNFLKPTNLTLNYTYSAIDSAAVTQDPLIEKITPNTNGVAQDVQVTLPTKPTEKLSLTFSYLWSGSRDTDIKYFGNSPRESSSERSFYGPDMRLVYLLRFDRPFKLWDIWPFYGRELRIKQNIQFDWDLAYRMRRDTLPSVQGEKKQSGPNLETDLFGWKNRIGYKVLDNVRLDIEYEWNKFTDNFNAKDLNYDSHRLGVNLEATF